jgi:hypothetical protein
MLFEINSTSYLFIFFKGKRTKVCTNYLWYTKYLKEEGDREERRKRDSMLHNFSQKQKNKIKINQNVMMHSNGLPKRIELTQWKNDSIS